MNGHPGGLTGTGTVTVKVLDINDNMPTLEKDEVEKSTTSSHEKVLIWLFRPLDVFISV